MTIKSRPFRPRQLIASLLLFSAYCTLFEKGFIFPDQHQQFGYICASTAVWAVIGSIYGWKSLAHALSPIASWLIVSLIFRLGSQLDSEGSISMRYLLFEQAALPCCASILAGTLLGLGIRATLTYRNGAALSEPRG